MARATSLSPIHRSIMEWFSWALSQMAHSTSRIVGEEIGDTQGMHTSIKPNTRVCAPMAILSEFKIRVPGSHADHE